MSNDTNTLPQYEAMTDKQVRARAKALSAELATLVVCGTPCEHDFRGWREFADGNGGEQVCTKCGMGAMAHSLRTGP